MKIRNKHLFSTVIVIIIIGLIPILAVADETPQTGNGGDSIDVILGPYEHTKPPNKIFEYYKFMPLRRQVFTEGCLDYGFETWLTVYNSSGQPADYSILVSGPDGYLVSMPAKIGARQRKTFDLMQYGRLGSLGSPLNISVEFYCNSTAIQAQESMYWDDRAAGHTNIGFTESL